MTLACPRNASGDFDAVEANVARIDKHLYACVSGLIELTNEGRIKFSASGECFAISALNDKKHNRPISLADHGFEFAQVFRRAFCDAIGKLGETLGPC